LSGKVSPHGSAGRLRENVCPHLRLVAFSSRETKSASRGTGADASGHAARAAAPGPFSEHEMEGRGFARCPSARRPWWLNANPRSVTVTRVWRWACTPASR